MSADNDRPIDETPAAAGSGDAARPPEPGLAAVPDGDLAFAPGTDVPLPPPPDDAVRCPWCSASLADPAVTTCPSCGAQLTESEQVDVPGLTAVDPVLLALANRPKPERRSLASWFAGDAVDEYPLPTEIELAALAPPDLAVRREMRRLELAAMGIVVEDQAVEAAPGEDAPGEDAPGGDAPVEPGPTEEREQQGDETGRSLGPG